MVLIKEIRNKDMESLNLHQNKKMSFMKVFGSMDSSKERVDSFNLMELNISDHGCREKNMAREKSLSLKNKVLQAILFVALKMVMENRYLKMEILLKVSM